MPQRFDSILDLLNAPFDDVIDVRSPSEFAEDHVPNAISLPVLSDAQRAEVGTIYTQDCPFRARKVGAALVARNAADHIDGPLAQKAGGWRPLVYCWRGGQRSGSFASILSQIGWRAETVEGGYRAYRRHVVSMLHDRQLPYRVVLLDGNTGTAKTDILQAVAERGGQVLDLEGLAAHRGSLFGAVAQEQPSQKWFETQIAACLCAFDPLRPVLVEAESSKVGNLLVPPSLWAAMCVAPRIRVSPPLEARAGYLVRAYADLTDDGQGLAARIEGLIPFQGHAQVAEWQKMAKEGAHRALAQDLMARHYDQRYAKSRGAKGAQVWQEIKLDQLDGDDIARAADVVTAYLKRALPVNEVQG